MRILAAMAALLSVACAKELPAEMPAGGPLLPDHYVGVKQARAAVEALLGELDVETRSGAVRSVTDVRTIGGPGDTRGDGAESPVYHLFNLGEGEGFAIATADDRVPSVFCVTDSGTFDQIDGMGRCGAGLVLLDFDINYRVATGLPIPDESGGMIYPDSPGYPATSSFGSGGAITDVDFDYGGGPGNNITRKTYPWEFSGYTGRQVACNWGQGEPYNLMMPLIKDNTHAYAGCGAVAVAQILYHYGYPASIDGYRLDWNTIRQYKGGGPFEESYPDILPRLFERLNSLNYLQSTIHSEGETGAATDRIQPTFARLGYQCGEESDYSVSDLLSAIHVDGRPVIVAGYAIRTPVKVLGILMGYNYSSGHYWICDRVMTYKQKIETYNWGMLLRTDYEYGYYVHCNWGWDGRCNGYFLPTAFDANHEPERPDTRALEGDSNYYQFNMSMWHQIKR